MKLNHRERENHVYTFIMKLNVWTSGFSRGATVGAYLSIGASFTLKTRKKEMQAFIFNAVLCTALYALLSLSCFHHIVEASSGKGEYWSWACLLAGDSFYVSEISRYPGNIPLKWMVEFPKFNANHFRAVITLWRDCVWRWLNSLICRNISENFRITATRFGPITNHLFLDFA